MSIEHKNITDDNIHEPKGVSTAVADKVYVSDGAGSGDWGKTLYTIGVEDYNDSGTVQALTSGAYVDLTNDGAGAFTNTTYKLPDGRSDIWVPATNTFEWASAGLELGDTVDIRFDVVITSSANNDEFIMRLDMAHGSVGEYQLPIFDVVIKNAGTKQIVTYTSLYIGDTSTLNNPAKVSMYSDSGSDSVVVNGWYVRTNLRTPVFV